MKDQVATSRLVDGSKSQQMLSAGQPKKTKLTKQTAAMLMLGPIATTGVVVGWGGVGGSVGGLTIVRR